MAATMAAAKVTTRTRAEWEARAFELAMEKHLTGAARYVGVNDSGARLWIVPSRSCDGAYLVTAWERGTFTCTCMAGSYGRPCSHAGAALHGEQQRARAQRQGDGDVMKTWRRGGAW